VTLGQFYPVLLPFLLFCAVSIALSRILLGMHFFSDVLAGAAVGGGDLGGEVGIVARDRCCLSHPWRGTSMRDPALVQVTGPLAPFAEVFRARLNRSGYALQSQAGHLRLMADLSRWLVEHRLNGSGSSPEVVAGSCWTGELPVTGTRARLGR